jgi:hypothetical protein
MLGIVNTDGSKPLDMAFSAIRAEARHHRIDTLFLVCHGFAGADKIVGMSADSGGMGLQIGKENLRHNNVALWRGIHGTARRIVVMACAASDTPPGGIGTTSDGRYLMGALALHTGANVYAANRIQIYYRYRNLIHGRLAGFDLASKKTLFLVPLPSPASDGDTLEMASGLPIVRSRYNDHWEVSIFDPASGTVVYKDRRVASETYY